MFASILGLLGLASKQEVESLREQVTKLENLTTILKARQLEDECEKVNRARDNYRHLDGLNGADSFERDHARKVLQSKEQHLVELRSAG